MKTCAIVLLTVLCGVLGVLLYKEHQHARLQGMQAEARIATVTSEAERRAVGALTNALMRAEAAEASLAEAQAFIARKEEETKTAPTLRAPRVMVTLRDGTQFIGEIIDRDSTNLVLQTEEGPQTIAWRVVAPATMMTLDPTLYHELKAQTAARTASLKKVSAALVATTGSLKKASAALGATKGGAQPLAKVKLGVDASEGCKVVERNARFTGTYQDRKNAGGAPVTGTRFSCWAKIAIKVDDVVPAEQHVLKLSAICYRTSLVTGDTNTVDIIEKKETLTGKDDYVFEYRSDPYEFCKSGRYMAGFQNDGFALKIWMDDTLIYEQKKNARGEFYIVSRR